MLLRGPFLNQLIRMKYQIITITSSILWVSYVRRCIRIKYIGSESINLCKLII